MLAALAFATTLMVAQPISAEPPPVTFAPDGVFVPGPHQLEPWPPLDAPRDIRILDSAQGTLLLPAPPCDTTEAKGWGACVRWTIDPKAPYIPPAGREPPPCDIDADGTVLCTSEPPR